jgi:signal transduction histidine kinase
MRYICYFFFFVFATTYSQKNIFSGVKKDSSSYYLELAKFHKGKNDFGSTLESIQKALTIAKFKNNVESQAKSYAMFGKIYQEINRPTEAIENYNLSIALYEKLEYMPDLAVAYYEIGVCYIEKKNYTTAENYFKKAEKIYSLLKIQGAQELINLQKGIVYYAKGHYKIAANYLNSVVLKSNENVQLNAKSEALYYIGLIEYNGNRNNLALIYFDRSLELSKKSNNLELQSKALKKISQTYDNLLNIEKSYVNLKQYLLINDSINKLRNARIGKEDLINFKESERLKTIELLDLEKKEQQRISKFSKLISILSIALISILSMLSLSLYRNNIIRSQTNKLLQENNNELQIAKDKAEKASQARAEFLSTVSHELRTPLNAINGITHLLIEENPKNSQLQYLTSLKFSGDYLLNFINDILEINRVESEKIEIESINLNVKQLLDDLHQSFLDVASKNSNQFILHVDPNIPDNLIGDPTKLSQIFINLINNALKFTSHGKVAVSASVVNTKEDITSILFEISDTGIGIPKDKQANIFESFSQGSIEINRKYGGTGLGLAIVKKLVSLIGGEIHLESTEGIGSKFSFVIDFRLGEQMYIEQKNQYDDAVFHNKKILIVEDNKINQMITKKMLENKQMQCEITESGEDAVQLARTKTYHLILMDVHLPGINGTEATKEIRAFNQTIPIIALTAISLNENREMLLSFGMTDVITKPFNPDNFYQVIAQQLN